MATLITTRGPSASKPSGRRLVDRGPREVDSLAPCGRFAGCSGDCRGRDENGARCAWFLRGLTCDRRGAGAGARRCRGLAVCGGSGAPPRSGGGARGVRRGRRRVVVQGTAGAWPAGPPRSSHHVATLGAHSAVSSAAVQLRPAATSENRRSATMPAARAAASAARGIVGAARPDAPAKRPRGQVPSTPAPRRRAAGTPNRRPLGREAARPGGHTTSAKAAGRPPPTRAQGCAKSAEPPESHGGDRTSSEQTVPPSPHDFAGSNGRVVALTPRGCARNREFCGFSALPPTTARSPRRHPPNRFPDARAGAAFPRQTHSTHAEPRLAVPAPFASPPAQVRERHRVPSRRP